MANGVEEHLCWHYFFSPYKAWPGDENERTKVEKIEIVERVDGGRGR